MLAVQMNPASRDGIDRRMTRRIPQEGTPRSSFEPAGAGAILAGTSIAGIGLGALIGWGAGSVGLGAVAGAIVGVPAGVFAVYRKYRGYFT
jgi:F0F1-type ATP synthase assembly protein I